MDEGWKIVALANLAEPSTRTEPIGSEKLKPKEA